MNSEDLSMIAIAAAGFIAFAMLLDCLDGPNHSSETGLGETLRGVDRDPWLDRKPEMVTWR